MGSLTPPSPVERYYTRYYFPDVRGNVGHDQYAFLHSNKLLIVGISNEHELATAAGREIASIDFNSGRRDRLDNKVSGKGKKGAQVLEPQSVLCRVHCTDGTVYTVLSGVRGHLLEINAALLDKPQLLRTHPESLGFVAIVNPLRVHEVESELAGALDPTQYQQHVMQRLDAVA